MSKKEIDINGSGDVFLDLGFSCEEAAVLRLKSFLFISLEEAVRSELRGTTQAALAEKLGTTQPIVSSIKNGKMSNFTLDRIIELLIKMRRDVFVDTAPADQSLGSVITGKRIPA